MITEFDSIFHENGFIFVNEMKQDVKNQMIDRIDSQRTASKDGHIIGKGKLRKVRKGSDGYGYNIGEKTGGADSYSTVISQKTGGRKHIYTADYLNRYEKDIQERRAKKKQLASKIGQKNINKALGEKKKAKQAVNASALMESIELI